MQLVVCTSMKYRKVCDNDMWEVEVYDVHEVKEKKSIDIYIDTDIFQILLPSDKRFPKNLGYLQYLVIARTLNFISIGATVFKKSTYRN